MKYFTLNKNLKHLLIGVAFSILLVLAACNPTKYILEEESLLEKSEIKIDNNEVKKNDLKPYIKQTPNKRIFGTRFYLGLYNLSNLEKELWPHGWLRRIGEEPVVFDPYVASKSTEQLENYLFSKGFFNASVNADYFVRKKRTNVSYNVSAGEPYKVRGVSYHVRDTTIRKYIFLDSINCLLIRDHVYDVDILQSERLRVERLIKDMGYYGFSRDDIDFRIDSSLGKMGLSVDYNIGMSKKIAPNGRIIESPHSRYRVKDVYIYPDFNQRAALDRQNNYFLSLDTSSYEGYNFVSDQEHSSVKPDVILQSLYIKPGDLFQITNTERTQTHLSSLQAFGRVNIRYYETDPRTINERGEVLLNCVVQITPVVKQAFRVELEGTNSEGNLGGALNLIYQHKNLFKGAEQLNIKLKGSYEALEEAISGSRNTQEYGFESTLTLPRFLIPFLESESFIKKYNPKTNIQVSYNYQKMPVYTRTVANATFGYNWRSGNYTLHNVNPVQFNVVRLPYIDPDFEMDIDTSSYLAFSYKDIMILGGNYTYIFNNQNINKARSSWYLKFNGELAGNLLASAYGLSGRSKVDGSYEIFNQSFAQYVRADIDIRYNRNLNNVSSMVYRAFAGLGIPYGNSEGMPFEKQYFSGGANGIRAWQVRSLGPGSHLPTRPSFFNATADIKLEFNAEYRFKLFWVLEGAVFLDAGNIWTFKEDEDRPGAKFEINNFYKELALGTGFGLRFDFNIIVLRTDLGMKLRDPQLVGGPDWIFNQRSLNWKDDFNFNLSIGYPF
ncbi:MAG: BamA/TamA family outer membrane protein [Bacteroidales bacterium]|nr:BamA/TamA family outer membrane protein [Bacteroidales bacterium]